MSKQIIFGGTYDYPDTTNTEYNVLQGIGTNWNSTEGNTYQVIPTDGALGNFKVKLSGTASSGDFVFTIRKNGVATNIIVTIAEGSSSGYYAGFVSFSAGDLVSVESNPSSTPLSRNAFWNIEFIPTTANETILMCSTGLSDVGPDYGSLCGNSKSVESVADNVSIIFPIAGTIKKLYWGLSTAPGSGKTRTATVYDVAGTTNTLVSSTISNTSTTGNHITYDEDVAADDRYVMKFTSSGTPTASKAWWSIVFLPDDASKFCVFSNDNAVELGSPGSHYNTISSNDYPWETTRLTCYSPKVTATDLRIFLPNATGSGKSRQIILEDDASSTALDITITNSNAGNDSGTVVIEEDSYLGYKLVNTNGPIHSNIVIGLALTAGDIIIAPKAQSLALSLNAPLVKFGSGFVGTALELTLSLHEPVADKDYSAYVNPHKYTIEWRNKDGELLGYLQDYAEVEGWEWNHRGGCGRCSISISKEYRYYTFNVMDDFQIKIVDSSGVARVVYRGWLASVTPKTSGGSSDSVRLDIQGYFNLLNYIIVQDGGSKKTYSSQVVSTTVTNIVDTFITPNTPITKGTIDATTFSADTLSFKTKVTEALSTCADLIGNIEYGVDENLVFYWRDESSTVNHKFMVGDNIKMLERKVDYSKLVNKIYFEGGEVAGTPYLRDGSSSDSITDYFLSEQVLVNSSITTSSVADQYITSKLAENNTPKYIVRISIPNTTLRLEDVIPMGKISIYDTDYDVGAASVGIWGVVSPDGGSGFIWGTTAGGGSNKIWGGGSGTYQDQVDMIKYSLSDTEDRFNIEIVTGGSTSEFSAKIKQLDLLLQNLRQRG